MTHTSLVQKLTPNSDFNDTVKENLVKPSHFSDLLQFRHKIHSLLNLNGQGHLHSDICNQAASGYVKLNYAVELQLQIVLEMGAFKKISLFMMAFPHSGKQQLFCLSSSVVGRLAPRRKSKAKKQ